MTLQQGPQREVDPDDLCRKLCPALFAASKLVALYGIESQVALDAVKTLQRIVDSIQAAFGFASIRVSSGTLFLNDYRVRMDSEGFMAFEHVVSLMGRRRVGEIRIGGGASEDHLARFLQTLYDIAIDTETPLEDIAKRLRDAEVHEIEVFAERALAAGQEHARLGDLRESSIDHYFKGVFVFRLLLEASTNGAKLDVRKCKRVIQGMVDILEREETTLLSLTNMKGIGGFLAGHAVNVAILTMAMGKRVGISRALLAKLGLAAMLHDLGRGQDATDSNASDAGHERRAAHRLLDSLGFSDAGLRCVLGALHHHAPFRSNGADGAEVNSLHHRLIATADFFDVITSPTADGARGQRPANALRRMSGDPHGRFDPRVVALLAELMGRYPFGTVIQLGSGESTVVCGRSALPDAEGRPIVRITETASGSAPKEVSQLDLGERTEDGATFLHKIIAEYSPSEAYGTVAGFVATL